MSKRCNSPYRCLSHIMAQRWEFTKLHTSTSIIPGQICPLHTMWAVRVRAVGVECFSWNVMPKYVITWSSYITARTAAPSTASGQSRSPLAACIVGRVIKRTRTSHRKQWQHVAPIQVRVYQHSISHCATCHILPSSHSLHTSIQCLFWVVHHCAGISHSIHDSSSARVEPFLSSTLI